jgi:hypothetical protein
MKPEKDNEATKPEEAVIAEEQMEIQASKADDTDNHNDVNLKRGKMITSTLVTTIIITFIAIAVAGVFQFTGWFLRVCPQELPVNDPSPILWKDVTSDKPVNATLGVPDKLKQETALKSLAGDSN